MHTVGCGCIAGGLRYSSSARRHKGSGGAHVIRFKLLRPRSSGNQRDAEWRERLRRTHPEIGAQAGDQRPCEFEYLSGSRRDSRTYRHLYPPPDGSSRIIWRLSPPLGQARALGLISTPQHLRRLRFEMIRPLTRITTTSAASTAYRAISDGCSVRTTTGSLSAISPPTLPRIAAPR
jgi:hypothetical protein